MKKKQLISIIITGVVIIAVGVTGILSNVVANRLMSATEKSAETTFRSLFSDITAEVEIPDRDFVGVLNIVGEIEASGSSYGSGNEYNHDLYMKYIDKMEDAGNNKGILLYVDSPGGAVYQSDELYLKLKEYKEKTGRPIWAYFASQACSGGYYISMAADKIYANRNCWTGSIGVIISLLNCKDLYDKLGIKEIDITSGKNKAMGSNGLDLTEEQYEILQGLVDEAYDQFVYIVVQGRRMSRDKVRDLADGRIYSALQALDNGLIDEVGSLEEEKAAFIAAEGLNEDILFYAQESPMSSFWDSLLFKAAELMPKSELELAADIMENNGNGVLKYYAK